MGKNVANNINLLLLARDGVILIGCLKSGRDTRLEIAPNLHENLANGDAFCAKMLQADDEHIQKNGISALEHSPSGEGEVQVGQEL